MAEIMDAMVAEIVMGWESEARYCGMDGTRDVYIDNGDTFIMYAQDWRPLINISQAFQVVDRMRELGFGMMIDYYREGQASGKESWTYYVSFYPDGSHNPGNNVAEDTPAMAICKAAISALSATI